MFGTETAKLGLLHFGIAHILSDACPVGEHFVQGDKIYCYTGIASAITANKIH